MTTEQKTRSTRVSVDAFVKKVPDAKRRKDAGILLAMMKTVTGETPRMWGPSMIGFGHGHYRYASGHEGETFLIGFSPRRSATVLYLWPGLHPFQDLLAKLGTHSAGKGCLYFKSLEGVDLKVLERLLKKAYTMRPDAAVTE
jgi:uncharacterized protein DUF1801